MTTRASSPSLPYLPPEILRMVFENNSKRDVQNVRLVCRKLNNQATPLVFDALTLRLDMTFYEYSQRPPFSYGQHVRSLTVLTAEYKRKDNEENYLQMIRDDCDGREVIYDAAAGQKSFERYQEVQAHHREALEAGEMLVYLVALLKSMPNLQRVFLSDRICRPSGCDRLMNCVCMAEKHDAYAVVPSSGLHGCGKVHWRILVTGLSLHPLHLSELVVTSNFSRAGLHADAFDTTSVQLQRTANIFAGLKNLHIGIMFDRHGTGVSGQNLKWLLSKAIHLQFLSIDNAFGLYCKCVDLVRLLGGCQYPGLRSLVRKKFSSTQEDLLQLLVAFKKLEHLHLIIFKLRSGSWEAVAEALKGGLLYLKDVQMKMIIGPARECPIPSVGQVQKYFRDTASNPFSRESLLKAKEERDARSGHEVYPSEPGIDVCLSRS
ncbi:MAG: hypothetical protein Q9200_006356 [Gallowayella weberi]